MWLYTWLQIGNVEMGKMVMIVSWPMQCNFNESHSVTVGDMVIKQPIVSKHSLRD